MVQIITDTTSCLMPEVAQRYQIPVIPQVINFGNHSYLESITIDNATFMQKLVSSNALPKTAAPPPELFIKEFQRLAPLGEPILCIHPSGEISGTVRSATIAAAEFPGADIRVIDTRLISTPLGTLVEQAAQWAEAGENVDEIAERVKHMAARARIYFLVATLDYLAKGGRIGGAAALLGGVLQIKPILALRNGVVDQYERTRTHKHAVARLKELVLEQCPPDGSGFLTVMHAGVPDEGLALARDLGECVHQEIVPIADVPPAIVTHGGPGILGVGFFVKN